MKILPDKRPVFKLSSFDKVCRYFFGDEWKNLYPLVEVAIRNPQIAFYNDELAIWTRKSQTIKTFNWNADPSAYILKGQPKAILKKGVHFYKLSYHHIWNSATRYVALRPATAGEELPVWRRDAAGKAHSSVAVAINQHKGGSNSTWSEGCQTAHFSQYPEFIQTIGDALGVKFPLGIVRRADPVLTKGIGKFPYILIEQSDFNYILNLTEEQFDDTADLKYQARNFVNLPKVEKIKPAAAEIENANAILSAVEIEEAENLILDVPEDSLPAINSESENQPPPNESESIARPVEIPQVKPEIESEKQIPGIKASFAAAVTFLTTSGAGIFGLFQGLQKEIVYGFFGATALIGMIFVVNRFWFANKEKERESRERMEREKRAFELQMLTVKSAADPKLNTVTIKPQPIANSEPATFAGLGKSLTLWQRLTGRI